MKILVINGANINMLGLREPEIYGKLTYSDLVEDLCAFAQKHDVELVCRQSNYEGELVGFIQEAYNKFDAIVINPAAHTHYSIAIMDAIKAVGLPAIEVHISNVHVREEFRAHSYVVKACIGQIVGLGAMGYKLAILALIEHLSKK